MRKFVPALLLLCLISTVIAQENTTWRAWLYNAASGELLLVDGAGFIQAQAQIPLPVGYSFYPYEVAISDSGQRIAYIVSSRDSQELLIYDPRPGIREIRVTYPLPPLYADGISFISDDSELFNDAETILTVGYSLKNGGWQIPVIDLNSGLATVILRGGAGLAAELPIETGVTPVVRRFDGRQVVFTLVQAADIGRPGAERGSYRWDVQGNTLSEINDYLALDSDTFASTGESVMVMANGEQDGSRLVVYDPATDRAETFFDAPDLRLFFPRFVQNGAAILVGAYDVEGRPSFRLIGRDGNVYDTWETGAEVLVGSLRGTADGFAYTEDSISADQSTGTTLYNVNMFAALDEGEELFTATVNTRPRIIWLEDPRLSAGVYVPWVFADDSDPSAIDEPGTPVAFSGSDEWLAWIYQDDGLAVRIDQAGEALDVDTLPPRNAIPGVANSALMPPARLTASRDGNLFAYVTSAGDTSYLQVYDNRADKLLLSHPIHSDDDTAVLAHTIERAPQHNLFNEDDSALAFGYGTGVGWQIDVVEIDSEKVVTSLRHDSDAMALLNTATEFGVVPVIQRYSGGQVHFTIQPPGALEPPYPSFVWDTDAETVNPTLIYASPYTDTFATTGEVIMALRDDRLPGTFDRFLYGQLNALHVYDPSTNTRYPFYNSEQLWLYRPLFIQNSERILSGGVDPSGAFIGWVVIERDGEQAGLLPLSEDMRDAAGTGNGFIYIPQDDSRIVVRFVNTRASLDSGSDIWYIERTGRPQIVWTGYETQQVTFRPWRVLALPVATGQATETPDSSTFLRKGRDAIVRTIGGDALYVHATPGRETTIITRLNSGTEVRLLEGPLSVANEHWWQIRTPGGVEGWVIEETEGIKTLTPKS